MANSKIDKNAWLHIAADSVVKYAEEGGEIQVYEEAGAMHVLLVGIKVDDERLPPVFRELIVY